MLVKIITQFIGFSLTGALMTIVSLALLSVLIGVFHTQLLLTYLLVYGLTIFLSFLINVKIVFNVSYSFQKGIKYFIIYLSSMLLGYLLLHSMQDIKTVSDWVKPLLVVPITLTWNFIFSYIFIKKGYRNA